MRDSAKTFVSLYAGAGGLDLGFVQAGLRPIWANDIDPDAVATYRTNIGSHIVCGDVDDLQQTIAMMSPDVIVGGPPCQGFSVAGNMRPDDPRSRHVWTFLEAVKSVSPAAFVMENVKNLAVNPRWEGLIAALKDFVTDAGYSTRVFLLNACHFGVPQARERMFMVGIKNGAEPTEPIGPTRSCPPTVRQTIAHLPQPGKPGNKSTCKAIVTPAKKPVLRKSPYAGMLFNGKGRALNLDAPAPTLPASMGGNRTPIVDQVALGDDSKENWVVRYHRKLLAGGVPVGMVPKRMRRLTVEEAALLQGFPATWTFHGSQSSRFRQIGNAVPPPLARAVAEQLLVDLAGSQGDLVSRAPERTLALA